MMLVFFWDYRSGSTLSVARSSPRVRARSLTPRLPRSSVWLPPSVSSTSATGSPSSAARPRRSRMRPYVYPQPASPRGSPTDSLLQNEYAQILAKRVAEAKSLKADLRKRRASSMRK
jgi:hypothetical protein